MSAQSGRDMLLKIDMNGAGMFETLAGLRTTRLSLNAAPVDVTSIESAGWRELLSGAGLRSAAVAGAGVFRDEASAERARAIFFAADTPRFQIVLPGLGAIEGAFQIASIDYAGAHDGEATFELSLSSAGPVEFAPAAAPDPDPV
ncbi:MAG: phage major tail protein, TP901-1 family [Paracoccaceae bacterium]